MAEQLIAAFRGRLFPPLGGYAYRFTVYLPLLSEGRKVFTEEQQGVLGDLFHRCFGGFSRAAAEGNPPWFGSWMPPGASRPIVDRHTLIVLYSPQTEEAKDFFRHLRWLLERKEVANQEIVLIEHTAVWLVDAAALPVHDEP